MQTTSTKQRPVISIDLANRDTKEKTACLTIWAGRHPSGKSYDAKVGPGLAMLIQHVLDTGGNSDYFLNCWVNDSAPQAVKDIARQFSEDGDGF